MLLVVNDTFLYKFLIVFYMILEEYEVHESCNISSNLVLEMNKNNNIVQCIFSFIEKYFSHYPHKK